MKDKKEKLQKAILDRLAKHYKDAHCALHHETPFQLLIATILSAQCTDERVNKVTPALFEAFPSEKEMAKAPLAQVEKLIYTTGFYKNKAKNIIACARDLVELHQGQIPQNLESITQLPGVGRKTGNVVLGNAFGITSGIVVDTHVLRLSFRFGWVQTKNAEIAERQLLTIVPKKDWVQFSHWMIFHGRQVCFARSPQCRLCFLQDLCPKKGVIKASTASLG